MATPEIAIWTEITVYGTALTSSLWGWLTGGSLVIIGTVYRWICNRCKTPPCITYNHILYVGFLGFLLIASFQVWEIQYEQVQALKDTEAIKARNAQIRGSLDEYLRKATLIQTHIAGSNTHEMKQGSTPASEYIAWHDEVRVFIKKELPLYEGQFEDVIGGELTHYPANLSDWKTWVELEKYKKNVRAILKEVRESDLKN